MFRREEDLAFRLGGEEFGVLALVANSDDGCKLAENILSSIRKLKIKHQFNPPGIITVSIGLCVVSSSEDTEMERIYEDADTALYEAKETGRNKYVLME